MANYTLMIRTLSPLHIGTGRELRNMFDFVTGDNQTGRMNVDKLLNEKFDPKNPNALPGELLGKDISNPAYFRYILTGRPRSIKADSVLRECVKDVYDVPYIPGSSIKGAMRTAFGAALLAGSRLSNDMIDLRGNPKRADDRLEKELFGADPQNDLFRALQISDAQLPKELRDPNKTMQVLNTNPITVKSANSSVPVEAECINDKLNFSADLKIDDYVLKEKNMPNKDLLSKNLMSVIKKHGDQRLHHLQDWYKNVAGAERINSFLSQLLNFSEGSLSKVNNMALMQMGFGTGWDGMTYSDWLKTDDVFFENLYQGHLRRKQNKGRAPMREPGTPFPTSRKVTMLSEKPNLPLGWVLLTLEPK